jgi:hypothetical protein
VYSIEQQGDLYKVDCEEHGKVYPGWRTLDCIPEPPKLSLCLVMAATLGLDHGKLEGVGEKLSAWEYLIY